MADGAITRDAPVSKRSNTKGTEGHREKPMCGRGRGLRPLALCLFFVFFVFFVFVVASVVRLWERCACRLSHG
jgi:hypothetical protein